jgi:oxygen-independent coproporphyrinogen-3 oxidase
VLARSQESYPFHTPNPQSESTLHLYLHIPFCHRICPYCSFYKHTPGDTEIGKFVATLVTEAKSRSQSLGSPTIETLYLGGGTPSMLSPTHLRTLFSGLRGSFRFAEDAEITMEANPATFVRSTASLYCDLGVNRVSLGAQSFDATTLETLGREHSPEEARQSFVLLREAGMPAINIDLMFSIPGQTTQTWETTLQAVLELQPDHISCYNLTYEEDTPFFERFAAGEWKDDDQTNATLFTRGHDLLTAAGYHHYETSNYARPGHESRHNQAYWEGADYLGLGPSAVSTVAGRRWKNIPDTARYLTMIAAVGHAEHETEIIGPTEFQIERVALLLRTTRGLPVRYLLPETALAVDRLCKNGLAVIEEEHLRLIGEGPLLVDSIAPDLIGE